MTPWRLLVVAVVALVATATIGSVLDLTPDSPAGLASGFVILGSAAVGLVALVWLPFDVLRHRRSRRDARFAALDEQPSPDEPVVWVVDENVREPEPLVQLRELDGSRTLLARVAETSGLHAPAPPVGTEAIIVGHGRDGSFEFVNAATYYDRDVAPEDDWIVLAHPVDTVDGPDTAATVDGRDTAARPDPPPTWPSA